MTYPRGLLLVIPTYLICSMFLTTYTLGIGATALSFDYNFSTASLWDQEQLKFMGASYPGNNRIVLTNDTANLTGRVAHNQWRTQEWARPQAAFVDCSITVAWCYSIQRRWASRPRPSPLLPGA